MKQIKDANSLLGKKIVGFKNDCVDAAFRLDFEDGTFVVFTTDYSCVYYESEHPTIMIEEDDVT